VDGESAQQGGPPDFVEFVTTSFHHLLDVAMRSLRWAPHEAAREVANDVVLEALDDVREDWHLLTRAEDARAYTEAVVRRAASRHLQDLLSVRG
jgi:hypothetical protein